MALSNACYPGQESGYQVHRLATELVPAYFSLLGPRHISPFWCVLFYLSLIMLGIAQSLATFHTLIQGLIAIKPAGLKAWEGSITFAVCSLGFILGLPAATEVRTIIDINLGPSQIYIDRYLLNMSNACMKHF